MRGALSLMEYYFNVTCTSLPNDCATFTRKSSDGLYVPLSKREILDFWVPTLNANSSCVIFCFARSSIIWEITSYRGFSFSYSHLNSESFIKSSFTSENFAPALLIVTPSFIISLVPQGFFQLRFGSFICLFGKSIKQNECIIAVCKIKYS